VGDCTEEYSRLEFLTLLTERFIDQLGLFLPVALERIIAARPFLGSNADQYDERRPVMYVHFGEASTLCIILQFRGR
jgi:hypothetical protein